MLINRRPDGLQLVTHPDHGRVAGELCRHWGNDRIAAPVPHAALLDAATHHDDGWAELDGRPAFHEPAERPAHFLEVPLPDTVGPYGRGVDEVYERDRLAGALTSMHWAGLYRMRWGLQGGAPVGHPATADVVAEQERRWIAGLRAGWDGQGRRSLFERDAWHAYEVLQALDFISLALCLLDLDRPSADGGEPILMPTTLPRVDQPAGPRLIPTVPVAAAGAAIDLRLAVVAPRQIAVDPFPFAAELTVELPRRLLVDRPYRSAADSAQAFHAAAVETMTVTVGAV